MFAHICAGILLALDTQTRLYVVAPGDKYSGFCLLGAKFAVYTGKWNTDLENTHLVADFATFDIHYMALANIAERLEALRFVGNITGREMDSRVEASDIDTPEKLVAILQAISISDPRPRGTDKLLEDLDKSLRRAVFSQRYLPIQPDTIQRFLTFVLETSKSDIVEEDDLPIFFPSHDIDFTDPVSRFLCAFGPEAPSPWNTAGEELTVAQTEVVEVVDGKRKKTGTFDYYGGVPEQLIFAPKPTGIAIKDWKVAISNKSVRMDMKERARAYRAVRVVHEETRKKMWKAMILVFEKVQSKVDKGKGKAREPVAKKPRPMEESFDDFMKLL
jgi:hypothetical protein